MNNSVNKSKLVESDELLILTKQGVKRAMEVKKISLNMNEINQVSGGIYHGCIPIPFPYGQPGPIIFQPPGQFSQFRRIK